MSELHDLLDTAREALSRSLAERLADSGATSLVRTAAGSSDGLVNVLLAACAGDSDAVRQWAAALAASRAGDEPLWSEALTGLHCLQRAVRFHLLRAISDKRTLLATLSEADAAVERLRQAAVAALVPQGPPRANDEFAALAEAFAEVNARKRAILESSLDPIITINHEGVITEYNRAAEQTFGHPRDRILGTKPSDVLFPPTLAPDQQTRIDRYLAAGEGSMLGRRAEVMAVRADGETFPAELAMTISLEGGEPVLTFFLRDISLRKQSEAETARHAAELERSNYELQQFAYVASHDLQEPLRKIRTFGDRLETKCKEQLDETGRECVDRMQSAAARMQALIDGLLSLSRVTTGGHEFVPVDLQRIAEEVVGDLEAQIERVGGRVEIGHLPKIQADPLQMRQLLQNLIGNGMKFHRVDEPPVVKVSGRFVHGRGERPTKAKEELCRIVVEDNGIGFEEKHAERIFGVFQRLHPRDVYDGTGIGLAVCRRIVERHGGTISAHSAPGAGSTFEVVVPVMQPRSKKSVVD